MKPTITARDRDKTIGMFLAHEFYRWARDNRRLTAMDIIKDFMKTINFPHMDEIDDWLINESNTSADLILQAVEETDQRDDVEQPDLKTKHKFMKQAIVMGAISEVEVYMARVKGGLDMDAIQRIVDSDASTPEDMIRAMANGIDPKLVETVALVICEDSYPNTNPTRDVLAALWLEGFFVAAFADVVSHQAKQTPLWNQLNDSLMADFEVI